MFSLPKNNFIYLPLLILLLVIIQPVFAEEDLSPVEFNEFKNVDLSKAIDIAMKNNRSILEEEENRIIYKLQVKQEFTTLLPTLGTTTAYQHNSNIIKNTALRRHRYSGLDLEVTATQPVLNLYENSLNYRIAKENYNISSLQTELQRELIINNVAETYFDLLKQYRVVDLNEQNIKDLEAYYKIAKDKFDAGEALARDYLKIQVEIDNAEHTLLQERNTLDLLKYEFKNTLGIDLGIDIDVVENYQLEDLSDKSLEDLQTIALEHRREIIQQEKNVRIAKLNRKVSLAAYIPDVDFYVSYVHLYGENAGPPDNLVLGVNASYDFWEWNKKYYNVKEQKAGIRRQRLLLQDQINDVLIDVKTQLHAVVEAKNLINVSKNTVELSKESLRITRNRFEVGLALVIDLLDDQNDLLSSEIDLVSSELDYQKSLINLKKTLGILYP